MAEKKKRKLHPNSLKNLKPIKPGEVRNPEGRRAESPVKAAMRKLTNEAFKDVIELALTGNLQGLSAIVKDPNASALKVGVAKCLWEAINSGDWNTLERIVERITGKVPVIVDHQSKGEKLDAPRVIAYIPQNGSTKDEQ